MSNKGVAKALAVLTAAYQREMTDPTIALYVEHLNDIDDGLLMKAANDLIIRSTYFPTIASIRDYCARLVLGDGIPPEAPSAWAEVMKAISSTGRHYRPQWRHALIGLALDEVGGYYDACMTSTIDITRMRFEKVYERMRSELIKSVAVTRFDYRGTPQALTSPDTAHQQRGTEATRPIEAGVQEAGKGTPRTVQGRQTASRDEATL